MKRRDNSKVLTFEDAEHIRALYVTGNYGQFPLADMFGVTHSHIANIIAERAWPSLRRLDGTVTLKIVNEILEKYVEGVVSQESLAREYKLAQGTVSLIINKKYPLKNLP